MKYNILQIFIVLFSFISCKTHLPFASNKEKKINVKLIKDYIFLTKNEFYSIKKEDSLLYKISESVKKRVNPKLIERRLDSFLLKKYNKDELFLLLMLDKEFLNEKIPFELGLPTNVKKGYKINNIKELKEFMKNIDRDLNKQSVKTKKMDTVK